MEDESKYGVMSIIFAIIAIILSWKKEFFSSAIIAGVIAIAFTYLTFYIKQIKENSERLNQLEKDLDINKRLIRVEEHINMKEK